MKHSKVGSVMTSDVVRATPDTPAEEVARLLAEHRISGLPVVDGDEKVLGVISGSDVVGYRPGAATGATGDWEGAVPGAADDRGETAEDSAVHRGEGARAASPAGRPGEGTQPTSPVAGRGGSVTDVPGPGGRGETARRARLAEREGEVVPGASLVGREEGAVPGASLAEREEGAVPGASLVGREGEVVPGASLAEREGEAAPAASLVGREVGAVSAVPLVEREGEVARSAVSADRQDQVARSARLAEREGEAAQPAPLADREDHAVQVTPLAGRGDSAVRAAPTPLADRQDDAAAPPAPYPQKGRTAGELMSCPAVTVYAQSTIAAAARTMAACRLERLPVTDEEDRIVGIVTRRDLLQVFLRPDEELRREVIAEILVRTLCLPPRALRVEVHEGVVTLEGQLERGSDIPVVVRLTQQVDGVVAVVDKLTCRRDDAHLRPSDEALHGIADDWLRHP